MKFSLIIPCFNEAKNLPLLLERCKRIIVRKDIEVILVNNGSTDNSSQVLIDLLPRYPGCRSVEVLENQGYGFGIISGLKESKGEVLGWTHADMQADPCDVLRGLEFFERNEGNVFVKGKRYGRPLQDILFTAGMSVFESMLLARPMRDINAQPTMFSRAFFESWEEPPLDFSLDLYAYYQAYSSDLCINRFPVNFGERAHGVSHWNVNWSAKRKFIQRTIEYSLQLRKSLKK
jgi:glycosyltransferase involved in cell wall biosynthesis